MEVQVFSAAPTIMKYIYKHGNQYWYQRAIPAKLAKILGKKTIKISLKTNKISTALVRSKLQAAELVAFETFNPILRSRGKSTDKAKEQFTPTFKRSMKAIFQKHPSGELSIPNMSHLLRRIEELEKQKTQS